MFVCPCSQYLGQVCDKVLSTVGNDKAPEKLIISRLKIKAFCEYRRRVIRVILLPFLVCTFRQMYKYEMLIFALKNTLNSEEFAKTLYSKYGPSLVIHFSNLSGNL